MPKRGRANKALKLTRWLGRRAAAYRQCQRDTLLKQQTGTLMSHQSNRIAIALLLTVPIATSYLRARGRSLRLPHQRG
jgi:hypothetical protein